MQIAVIGGGVVGVSSAFFLAQAGHEVVVLEQQTNVAEGISFGSNGVMSPAHALAWATPDLPKKLLSMLFKPQRPLWIDSRVDLTAWRWLRLWMAECDLERYRTNYERCYRIAGYSQEVMRELQQAFPFEFEHGKGYLQLYRTAHERTFAAPLHTFLAEREVAHRLIEPEEIYTIEPGLSRTAPLAGGLHIAQDESGNCPLFCKHLRAAAQALGVTFHFGTEVTAIERDGNGPGNLFLHIGESRFPVGAVVVAAGAGSAALLAPFDISLPFFPVRSYAATALIRNFDDAPLASLADPAYQVAITRMGLRMRMAGTFDFGTRKSEMRNAAIHTLLKVGQDWFPDAINYNAATFWSGVVPTLPDGPPILGATRVPNLYLNIGHATNSWAMAAGCGRVLADLISGRQPDIDIDGLTLSRFG